MTCSRQKKEMRPRKYVSIRTSVWAKRSQRGAIGKSLEQYRGCEFVLEDADDICAAENTISLVKARHNAGRGDRRKARYTSDGAARRSSEFFSVRPLDKVPVW